MPDFRARPANRTGVQLGRPAHGASAGHRQQVGMASNAEWIRIFAEELQALLQQVQDAPLLATALSDVFSADRALTASSDIEFTDGGAKGELSFRLTLTGLSPGTYGAALKIPVLQFDDKGRAISASEISLGTAAALDSDNDAALSANSSTRLPTQAAVKAFVDAAVTGVMSFKGDINCSTNPNYPAGAKGDSYVASVAGKIGGASGKSVDVGDLIVCRAINAGGTEASVGASWFVLEHNLLGALLAANNLGDIPSPSLARTNLGLAIGSDVQAFNAGLSALAALTGTNTIYYRSAANTWTAVVIGGDLSFTGGALNVGGGTGTDSVARATKPEFTNTIGVGAAAAADGSGVSFSATQSPSSDPNTLDDYEEGTWTPTVTAEFGAITTMGAVSASYTKIGRLVTVTVTAAITTAGTGAGALLITLPFTIGSSDYIGVGRENSSTGNILQVMGFAGATQMRLLTYNNGSTIGSGYTVLATLTYAV